MDQGVADSTPEKSSIVVVFADKSIERLFSEVEAELEAAVSEIKKYSENKQELESLDEENQFFVANWHRLGRDTTPTVKQQQQTDSSAKTSGSTTVIANRGCCGTEGAEATNQYSVLASTAGRELDCNCQAGAKRCTKQNTDTKQSGPEQIPQIFQVKRPPPERGKLQHQFRSGWASGSHKLAIERVCRNIYIPSNREC